MMYDFTTEIQGNVTYLVLRLQPDDAMDPTAWGMMNNNKIPGMLPVTRRWEKQSFALYYTISSLTPLPHCAGLFGDERRMTRLLRSFCQMLIESEEYLLEQNSMLLDQEHVFVKAATGDISVIYLPILNCKTDTSAKMFLNQLIRNAVQKLPQDSLLVNLLLRESFREDFIPGEFLQRLDGLYPHPQPAPQSSLVQPQIETQTAQSQPENPPQQPRQKSPLPADSPAMRVPPVPQPEKRAEETTEKHGLFGFGTKKDNSKKKKTKKKEIRLTEEENFDNPFATNGKILPRGPVTMPPEPEEEQEDTKQRKEVSLGGLFSFGGNKAQGKKREDIRENTEDNPFTQQGNLAAETALREKAAQQPSPQPQQIGGTYQAPIGSGYTVNLQSPAGVAPQATVAMDLRFASPEDHQQAGFPVIWLEEKKSGNRVQITHDNFHVGRKLDTDDIVDYAVLTATPYMGSDHCYFVCHGSQMFVVDNNSFNGTWVNGQRITPGTEVPIEQGTIIRMADVTFVVR